MSTRNVAIKEGGKALLKRIGKKSASALLGRAAAMLSPLKAHGGQPTTEQLKKRQALRQDYYDTLGPKKKTKMSMRKPKASICPSGIAWAKRTFDKYPSAYANMAASKYCKDPNYAKGSKKKKK